jgi:hypothetical protein
LQELLSAGWFFIRTVGLPGIHGAVVTGTHGIWVRTPSEAAVAAATCGFAKDLHIPKGIMLTIGLLSIMVAAGLFSPLTILSGKTINSDGVAPKLHVHCAVATTNEPMLNVLRL